MALPFFEAYMVFEDRTAPRQRKSSKTFAAPTKCKAYNGRFMMAGDDYGVGFNQPIGTEVQTKKEAIPQKSQCFSAEDL